MQPIGQAATVNPRAPTWRNAAGEIVATSDPSTFCFGTFKPARLTAVSADGSILRSLRCRKCGACLELDRRILAKRLAKHFEPVEGELWTVSIACRRSNSVNLARAFRHAGIANTADGFLRNGPSVITLIAIGSKPNCRQWARDHAASVVVTKLKRSRGSRGWRGVCAGMLTTRDDYGEQTNRYYWRGLPAAETEHWQIERGRVLRHRRPEFGPGVRVVNRDLGLIAPEAWRPLRIVKRKAPESAPAVRVNQPLTAIGASLERVLPGIALANSTVNRAPAQAGALVPVVSVAAKPPPTIPKDESFTLVKREAIQVPSPTKRESYAEWGERMAKRARERDRGG
jgi:hypothetical protein